MGQEFAQGAEWAEGHGPDWWLLDPSYTAEPDHRGVRDLVRDLNAEYRAAAALWERDTEPSGFSWIVGESSRAAETAETNVFAFLRFAADGSPLVAVSNFSPVVRDSYRLGVPEGWASWYETLNTDAARYGGSGIVNTGTLTVGDTAAHGRSRSVAPTLPPLGTVWLRPC
jgi:1,4-alpha-glucan branching enzyme